MELTPITISSWNNVIQLYTRDTFLYRLLNQALRIQDILHIFLFRFVLVDLHNHLENLHTQHIYLLKTDNELRSELIVFRGQGLTVTELQKLKSNTNGRIAMNSFLSTSTSSSIALGFSGNGSGRPLVKPVFFEIHCPVKEYQTKPFANIQNYSYTKEENEELSDTIWHVKLTLCDDDNDLNRIESIDYLKSEIDHRLDISFLAKLFIDINELDKAKDLYNLIVKDLPSDHCDRVSIKTNIGTIHFGNGQYCDALKYCRQALKINRLLMPKDFITLSMILNNIGHAYNKLGNYLESIEYHKKALQIQKKFLIKNNLGYATTCKHLGVVYDCLSKHKLALTYLEQAKKILEKYLPEIHPHIGDTFNNIGEIYLSNNRSNEARINLEKSLEIRLESLPTDHPILSVSYSNLGCAHDRLGNSQKALEYHNKSLNICLKSMSKNHPDLATTYNNIAQCYNELDNFTSALFFS
ncbi:unnamed protein product [Rotaria socialis]|uniref:Kinesin light chain n=2 Tax=Rotaria socialis TaxID=392032 RepID=A0A821CVG4_9BILA|nr:unnamed protein product [Rotaria socialis]